ncbi:hypothetical protein GPX89_43475 [Nocardia sp. ET3-3]|uniref:Uncharacterized protein n=1 Tax=Nocardia terrae TaxID=2675851 RepID=A0A7K1VD82_9NOCA|nr:hypothetical protein [Nocardia terrae]MVU84078.1 hypothetical protein [Nocardia terrae]
MTARAKWKAASENSASVIVGSLLEVLDILILLIGIVVVLLSDVFDNLRIVSRLLEQLGTGLVTAAIVSVILRIIAGRTRDKTSVQVVTGTRQEIERQYRVMKRDASEISILAIALTGALEDILANDADKFLERVLFERLQVRFIFLSPGSAYARIRAAEEGMEESAFKISLETSVERSALIYQQLKARYDEVRAAGLLARDKSGRFEIRVIDACPHCTIFHADSTIYWGLYTSRGRGYSDAVLKVPSDTRELYSQLVGHFESLWNSHSDWQKSNSGPLVKFDGWETPRLNERLITRLTAGHQ